MKATPGNQLGQTKGCLSRGLNSWALNRKKLVRRWGGGKKKGAWEEALTRKDFPTPGALFSTREIGQRATHALQRPANKIYSLGKKDQEGQAGTVLGGLNRMD